MAIEARDRIEIERVDRQYQLHYSPLTKIVGAAVQELDARTLYIM